MESNKKELLLSALQLAIVVIGEISTIMIDFPAGVIILAPLGIMPLTSILKQKIKHVK